MYQLRGVPKVFQTRDQALAFLRNSPGYVSRQSAYLKTYWPGLYASVKTPPVIAKMQKNMPPQAPPGKGIDAVIARVAKATGTAIVHVAKETVAPVPTEVATAKALGKKAAGYGAGDLLHDVSDATDAVGRAGDAVGRGFTPQHYRKDLASGDFLGLGSMPAVQALQTEKPYDEVFGESLVNAVQHPRRKVGLGGAAAIAAEAAMLPFPGGRAAKGAIEAGRVARAVPEGNTVRFAFEAASKQVPEYWAWDPHVQAAFTQRTAQHVVDAVQSQGFTARLNDYGISAYKNTAGKVETNPGIALELGVKPSRSSSAARLRSVTPAQRRFYDGMTAAINDPLKQEAGGWIRTAAAQVSKQHTFWRVTGKVEDPARLAAMADAVDAAGGYISPTTDGYLFVMQDPDAVLSRRAKNGAFADLVYSQAETHGLEAVDAGSHRGGYVGRLGYENAIDSSGRPDLLRGLHRDIADRADATQAEFAADPAGAAARHAAGTASAPRGLGRLADETGSLTLGRTSPVTGDLDGVLAHLNPRELTLGEHTQQLGFARSRLSRTAIDNPVDAISKALSGTKIRNVPLFKNATSDARVAKYAGKRIELEAQRAQGAMHTLEKALPKKAESPEDVAHFWWAQLPPENRNADGLRLVRNKQNETLDALKDGTTLRDLQAELDRVEGELTAWNNSSKDPLRTAYKAYRSEEGLGTGGMDFEEYSDWAKSNNPDLVKASEAFRADPAARKPPPYDLLGERASIQIAIADIPKLLQDMPPKIARLDEVIANPPPLDPAAINAVHKISAARKKTLVEAGVLKPGEATQREGLVADWLGLNPSGEEAYIGHRPSTAKGGRPSGLPAAVGTGRPRTPSGIGRQNQRILISNARAKESTHVTVDDWRSAQVYKSALSTRADLGRMGRRFDPTTFDPTSEILVNPKSRSIPVQWRAGNPLDTIAEGGYDEEQIRQAADDLVGSYVSNPDDAGSLQRVLDQAKADGVYWDDLRVVKKDTAERYFSQFTPAKRAGPALNVYDKAVDGVVASIVFARIGYIPKNVLQNLIMAIPHQGVFLVFNAPRAGQIMRDPELNHLFQTEVGFSGSTISVSEETVSKVAAGVPHKIAGMMGGIADTPARITAMVHELAAMGVLPKYSAVLSDADRATLKTLLTDEKYRPILDAARNRAVESMADFSRLTPTQRKNARRFLIIPGWLWAGSRYPVHFAATHPGRSAAIAYVAAGEPGAPSELQVNKPITDYMAHGVPPYAAGIDLGGGSVFRTGSISPISTPWEIAAAATGHGKGTLGGYSNPVGSAIWDVAHGQTEAPDGGAYQKGSGWHKYANAALSAGKRITPNYAFIDREINPKASKVYPDDASRVGRLKRELGVFPIHVNKTEGTRPKAYTTVFKERNEVLEQAHKIAGIDELPQALKDAYNLKAAIFAERTVARKASRGDKVEYDRQVFVLEATLAARKGLITDSELQAVKRGVTVATVTQLESGLKLFRQQAWSGPLRIIHDGRAELKAHGAVFTHGN